jgi:hypothetical protein
MKLRSALICVLIGIGAFTFFLPLFGFTAPIVGSVKWSALNIVSQATGGESDKPSLSKMTDRIADVPAEPPAEATAESTTPPTRHEDTPLGIKLLPTIPLAIVCTYLLLVICAVGSAIRKSTVWFAAAGFLTGLWALVGIFIANDSIHTSLFKQMSSPEMQDNPFAGIGQLFAQSIKLEPGLGLYLLVIVMLALVLVQKLTILDRLEVTEKAAESTVVGGVSSRRPSS